MLLRLITVLLTIFVFAACEEVEPPTALDAGMTRPNRSPSAPTVAIAPANPTTTDDLTVSFLTESKDPDGDTVTQLAVPRASVNLGCKGVIMKKLSDFMLISAQSVFAFLCEG